MSSPQQAWKVQGDSSILVYQNLQHAFSVCLFAYLLCVHIVFEHNFVFPLFFLLSHLHCCYPSIPSPKNQSEMTNPFFSQYALVKSSRWSKKAMHAVNLDTQVCYCDPVQEVPGVNLCSGQVSLWHRATGWWTVKAHIEKKGQDHQEVGYLLEWGTCKHKL